MPVRELVTAITRHIAGGGDFQFLQVGLGVRRTWDVGLDGAVADYQLATLNRSIEQVEPGDSNAKSQTKTYRAGDWHALDAVGGGH